MNFFEYQEQSRKKTVQLVLLMIIAVFAIIAAVYAAVMLIFMGQGTALGFDPCVFSGVAAAVLTLVIGGSAVKLMALRRGGDYVAQSLGGRPVHPETQDPREKMLVNVVEEMALASGIAVPAVYVLDEETGMNAFAAGDNPTNTVVAVTSGLLNQLSRDELQGVVAHEFSHILNGDMRLNMRLIGMISGIMVLATIGRVILRSAGNSRRTVGSSRGKNGGPLLLMGLVLFIIGYVGVFVSRIIQSAVSRQREFLADASAVQFTRNPLGIAGALKKIGGYAKGSLVRTPLAQEASHLFFSSAVGGLFATHPPLAERIRRIDPGFSGSFPAVAAPDLTAMETPEAAAFSGPFSDAPPTVTMDPGLVTKTVGTIDPDRIRYSATLLKSIPAAVRRELTDPLGASSVVLALMLSPDNHEKALQIEALDRILSHEQSTHVARLDQVIQSIPPELRLPVTDLAMPMLRRMSPMQMETFRNGLKVSVETDGRLNFFEFAVGLFVTARLAERPITLGRRFAFTGIEPLIGDIADLISKLSMEGHGDPIHAQKAFRAAMIRIPGYVRPPEASTMPDPSFSSIEKAISRLSAASPGIKKTILDVCAHCVLFDRAVSPAEAEMLRAVAYALDLPLPPFLTNRSGA